MPEGKGYGPQNTASTGLNLNIIGDFIYGFSGSIGVGNSETDLLDYTTGNYYVVGGWFANFNQLTSDPIATEDFRFVLYLNDIQIAMMETADSQQASRATVQDLIIPPFTNVKVTGRNYTGSANEPCGVVITGKVYK